MTAVPNPNNPLVDIIQNRGQQLVSDAIAVVKPHEITGSYVMGNDGVFEWDIRN